MWEDCKIAVKYDKPSIVLLHESKYEDMNVLPLWLLYYGQL